MLQLSSVPTIPYDEAVREAKKIMSDLQAQQWELGDIASHLSPIYGGQTLKKFAAEISINLNTLNHLVATSRAWPEKSLRGQYPHSLCRALNALPDRKKVIAESPGLTIRNARQFVKEHKLKRQQELANEVVYPYQEPCTDCNTAVEQWQRSVGNFLGDVLTFRAYWDRLFGSEWHQYPLPSAHLKMVTDAVKEFDLIVTALRGNPNEKED